MKKNLKFLSSFVLLFLLLVYIPAFARQTATLDVDINNLSRDLGTEKHLAVDIDQDFLGEVTAKLAKASRRDLLIKVLPGRLMSSQSDLGFAKYDNYLDLKSGGGTVDLREADVQGIKNGRIHVLIDMAGKVKAQAQGKQIGFNYNAAPEIGITVHDRLAFVVESAGEDFLLRPTAKQLIAHLDIGVAIDALGTSVNTSRDMPIDVANMMRPIKLPKIVSPSLSLPGGNRSIVLTGVGYRAEDGKLQLNANLEFK
jgi:hypothetical protein